MAFPIWGLFDGMMGKGRTAPAAADLSWFTLPVDKYSWLFPAQAASVEKLVEAQRNTTTFFPSSHHFLLGVQLAIILSLLRAVLDYLVFIPLARVCMKLAPINVGRIVALEKEFKFSKAPTKQRQGQLSVSSGMSMHDVSVYFRRRRQEDRQEKKIAKFKEACWRDLIYIAATVVGALVVVPQPWFSDIKNCWRQYPFQEVPEAVYLFYMFELGVYLHLVVYQFFDTKRSDFWEMFVHHLATLGLIVFSWMACFVRAGTLIMLVHDVSDVFLESAKIFNYMAKTRAWAQSVTDVLFVVFALTFGVTRLGIYPFWIIHSTWTHAHEIIGGPYPAQQFFYAMLYTLQALHIFWFYLIARMAVGMLLVGKIEKDVRSDDEESDGEVEPNESRKSK